MTEWKEIGIYIPDLSGNAETNADNINGKIDDAFNDGGGVVLIDKNATWKKSIIIKPNVELRIGRGVTLTLDPTHQTQSHGIPILFQTNAVNAALTGYGATIEFNGENTNPGVFGKGGTDTRIEGLTFKNWKSAIQLRSNNNAGPPDERRPALRNRVIDCVAIEPANVTDIGHPIQIVSGIGDPWCVDCALIGNTVIGVRDAHNAAGATADQILAQGWLGGVMENNRSYDGGEVGLTCARLSRSVRVVGNEVRGADAHGIDFGSAYTAIKITEAGSVVDGVDKLDINPSSNITVTNFNNANGTATITIPGDPENGKPGADWEIMLSGFETELYYNAAWRVDTASVDGSDLVLGATRRDHTPFVVPEGEDEEDYVPGDDTASADGRIRTGLLGATSGTIGVLTDKNATQFKQTIDGREIELIPGPAFFIDSTSGFWEVGETVRVGDTDVTVGEVIGNSGVIENNICLDNRLHAGTSNAGPDDMAEIYVQQFVGSITGNIVGQEEGGVDTGAFIFTSQSQARIADNTFLGDLTYTLREAVPQRVDNVETTKQMRLSFEHAAVQEVDSNGGVQLRGAIQPVDQPDGATPTTVNDLETINRGKSGDVVFVFPTNNDHPTPITNAGNITLAGGRSSRALRRRDSVAMFVNIRGEFVEVGDQRVLSAAKHGGTKRTQPASPPTPVPEADPHLSVVLPGSPTGAVEVYGFEMKLLYASDADADIQIQVDLEGSDGAPLSGHDAAIDWHMDHGSDITSWDSAHVETIATAGATTVRMLVASGIVSFSDADDVAVTLKWQRAQNVASPPGDIDTKVFKGSFIKLTRVSP